MIEVFRGLLALSRLVVHAPNMEESTTTGRTRRTNEIGPMGAYVAANVKRLRESLPLTTEQLAERTTGYGRPMRGNTITKIEKGQRRVDVDDLTALALALETRPDALLLPGTIVGDIQLAETKTVPAYSAWRWANGTGPLELPDGDDGRAFNAFQTRAQPPGLGMFRYKPEEIEDIFRPKSQEDTSGEHREEAER
ncbi:helix-turn-helix domain-containing protein [Streptomyces lavendulae]|uniref:helix-turn-helix domain-containing protein n=1 Tax=Streptomyces lavendulae TaxID=1914 RepID=UPI0033F3A499